MNTFKIDIDVAMSRNLLNIFLKTRLEMLKKLGYTVLDHRAVKTHHGFHMWFHVLENPTDLEACTVQFLLGDDQSRVRFNFLRNDAKAFRQFNALFSKKLKHSRGNEGV